MFNFTQVFTNLNVAHAWMSSRATSGHARHWVSAQLSDPHPWPRVCPQFAEVFHCTVHVRDALDDTHTPSGVTRNRARTNDLPSSHTAISATSWRATGTTKPPRTAAVPSCRESTRRRRGHPCRSVWRRKFARRPVRPAARAGPCAGVQSAPTFCTASTCGAALACGKIGGTVEAAVSGRG
jgi:hypothetical protein